MALLCSFEPTHLETYLQACLVERFPEGAPAVMTFGYDQLSRGLAETATTVKNSTALLFLSWGDLHPALCWRSRAALEEVEPVALLSHGHQLIERLTNWMEKRGAAETYVVAPPLGWLPPHDPCSVSALGPVAGTAAAAMWELQRQLSTLGARILRPLCAPLDFRGLLLSGCPLTTGCSELVARQFVKLAFPQIERKKALIVDLDGTLWAGVIGEDGPERLRYQPDGRGFAFHTFQKVLLKLKREGVFLAFCTKNNPTDVLGVFDSLEMPLKLETFSAYRCNWESKPANIESIATELNIGCDSVVFIDDNPAELAAVASRLPVVTLLQTPKETSEWRALFEELQNLFATWRVSGEDRIRTTRSARSSELDINAKIGEQSMPLGLQHLSELRLEITLKLNAFGDARSLELVNKTNQFNLNGNRVSHEEWLEWAAVPGAFCLSARLRDRYGDFGTICVAVGRRSDHSALRLEQFVLSCRAFGRGVESLVLGELLNLHGATSVSGAFRKTGKNDPARNFLSSVGCDLSNDGEWLLSEEAIRRHAELVYQQTGAAVCHESE